MLLRTSAHNACEVDCLLSSIAWLVHWHDLQCSETPTESPSSCPELNKEPQLLLTNGATGSSPSRWQHPLWPLVPLKAHYSSSHEALTEALFFAEIKGMVAWRPLRANQTQQLFKSVWGVTILRKIRITARFLPSVVGGVSEHTWCRCMRMKCSVWHCNLLMGQQMDRL